MPDLFSFMDRLDEMLRGRTAEQSDLLSQASEVLESGVEQMTDTTEEIEGSLEEVSQTQEAQLEATSATKQAAESLDESAGALIQQAVEGTGSGEEVRQQLLETLESQFPDEVEPISNQIRESLAAVDQVIDELSQSSEVSSEAVESVSTAFEDFQIRVTEVQEQVVEGALSVEQAQEQLEDAGDQLSAEFEEALSLEEFEGIDEVVSRIESLSQNVSGQFSQASQSMQQIDQSGASLVEIAGAFSEIGGSADLLQTLVDKTRTSFQRILGYVRSLGAGLTAVVGSLAVATDLLEDSFDAARDLREETGFGAERMREFRAVTRDVSTELAEFGLPPGATTEITTQLIEDFGSIRTATGIIGEDFETITIRSAALSESIGVSAEKATQIQTTFEELENLIGGSAEAAIVQTRQLAQQQDVAPQAAFEQITENAEQLAQFGSNTVDNLSKAAVEAQKLGTNLGSVAEFQEQTLTNITGQIQNIQEANLLIGNQLNASRLLQASYQGTGEALDEVRSQLEGIDIESMNFFQRQRLAEALPGFSLQEIERIAEANEVLQGVEGTTSNLAQLVSEGKLDVTQALRRGENVDAVAELNQQFDALYFTLAEQLGPVLSDLLQSVLPALTSTLEALKPLIEGFGSGIAGTFRLIAATAQLVTGDLQEAKEQLLAAGRALGIVREKGDKAAGVWTRIFQAIGAGLGIAAVIKSFTALGSALASLLGISGSLSVSLGTLATILTGPVGAAVALAAAALTGILGLYYNWDEVTRLVGNTLSWFGGILTDIGNYVGGAFMDAWEGVVQWFESVNWTGLGEMILDAFLGLGSDIIDALIPDFETVRNKMSDLASVIRSYLPSSPAEVGPLSDIDQVDVGGTVAEQISPEPVEQEMEATMQTAQDTAATAVEAQPAQENVQMVETGGDQAQQQPQQEVRATDTSEMESLLREIRNGQQNLISALKNGEIAVYLDGRKVNKEILRNVNFATG